MSNNPILHRLSLIGKFCFREQGFCIGIVYIYYAVCFYFFFFLTKKKVSENLFSIIKFTELFSVSDAEYCSRRNYQRFMIRKDEVETTADYKVLKEKYFFVQLCYFNIFSLGFLRFFLENFVFFLDLSIYHFGFYSHKLSKNAYY